MLPILLVTANPPRVYTRYTRFCQTRVYHPQREREGEGGRDAGDVEVILAHLTYVERGNSLRYLEIYNAPSIHVVVRDYYWARTIATG